LIFIELLFTFIRYIRFTQLWDSVWRNLTCICNSLEQKNERSKKKDKKLRYLNKDDERNKIKFSFQIFLISFYGIDNVLIQCIMEVQINSKTKRFTSFLKPATHLEQKMTRNSIFFFSSTKPLNKIVCKLNKYKY
jgi:hypothetical protein